MLKMLFVAMMAVPMSAAASSPAEADFPSGYWDRDAMAYGRAITSYNVSIAAAEPARLRAQVEKLGKAVGANLTGFSDQTNYPQQVSPDYAMAVRTRPAYTLTYQLPIDKATSLARQIVDMGRLINYTSNTPYGTPQKRELDEKIGWIEREQRGAAGALKTMPVSRALLTAKLKSLRQVQDSVKASEGLATISVQILREEAEPSADARPAPAKD